MHEIFTQNNKNFKNVLSEFRCFLNYACLLKTSNCFLSTELYVTRHIEYTQQVVMFRLVHKVLCMAVVSLQSCFEIYVLLICDKCPVLKIYENKNKEKNR